MEKLPNKRLGREDWIHAALGMLKERGVDGLKIVGLAERLGVTSGSFYWHFADRSDLLASLLGYWEIAKTDAIIAGWSASDRAPADRILGLMTQVVEQDTAALDQVISVWAWA